jgi:hypothetical protein
MTKNLKQHHVMNSNTEPIETLENPCISTSHFYKNELSIEELHTDRLNDLNILFAKTSIRKYYPYRPNAQAMSTEEYQKLIKDTAILLACASSSHTSGHPLSSV